MSQKSSAVAEPEILEYRLPRTVVPSRYEIRLSPDLEKFIFEGKVIAEVQVTEAVKEFLLNSTELKIHSAYIKNDKGEKLEARCELIPEKDRLKLSFDGVVAAGQWKLFVDFQGELNDKLRGFYKSTYKDENGKDKVLASTQFEATDARRAFPCWDEPDFKATYKVYLTIDEKLCAISNGALLAEKPDGKGKKEVEFKETVKMSTYLVAFIVGEFEASEPAMAGKTPVRVWSVPGKKALAEFGRKVGVHSLNYFEKYYGVPYIGEKLDLIAIPDFAFGAMENLGCVTFRETALLVDEKTSSHAELERVADVVAHEIAHMWFGDLTTMGWWNGIWLNEAFATFAEMLAVDAYSPEWKRWESFGVSRAAAFTTDGLQSTRPIEFPVRHAHECEAMFDVLTYQKGASVLRMLEQFLDEDAFRKGVSHYLDKHKFANTETSDLWDAIEEKSKAPVRQLMDSWIYQKGYPMVSVNLDAGGKKLVLSQQRFFYLQDAEDKGAKQLFHVPLLITVSTKSGLKLKKVLLKSEKDVIDLDDAAEWAVVNAGGHGFYRVCYQPELLQKLTANVFENLSGIERFNLVNDTWAMVLAGHTKLEDYLKMIKLFEQEKDKNVWSIICGSLSYLDRIVSDADRSHLEQFTKTVLAPIHAELGWEPKADEDQLRRQLRGLVIGSLGNVGNCGKTQKMAAEVYDKFAKSPASVDPNVIPAVVSILAACGDAKRYDEFSKLWKESKTPQEEERYLYALGGFKDSALLQKTLERTLNGEIRTQDGPYLIRSMMMNPQGRELTWNFVKKNWQEILAKFPDNSISRMLEGLTALVSPALEKDVNDFIAANPIKQGGKIIDQHLERLKVAVLFQNREGSKMAQSLKA